MKMLPAHRLAFLPRPTADGPSAVLGGRTALVVAHPGDELRVVGWLEHTRPVVFVLTDGSGGVGKPRLQSTRRIVQQTASTVGSLFGRWPDSVFYQALLARRVAFFRQIADELAEALGRTGAQAVVSGAAQGFNPMHDVCRLLVDAAVARVRGTAPVHYEYALLGPPDACPEALRSRAAWLRLGPAGLERKLAASRSYAELSGEVEAALATYGPAAFATECLRPVTPSAAPSEPLYEAFGRNRVAVGRYRNVIRYRDHLAPLAEALGRRSQSLAT
jgi:hypothetical protein